MRKRNSSKVSSAALPSVPGKPEPTTRELSAALHASRRPWVSMVLGVLLAAAVGLFFVLRPVEVLPGAAADAGAPLLAATEDAGAELDAGALIADVTVDAGADEPEVVDAGAVAALEPLGIKRSGLKKRGKVNVITTHGGEPYWAQVSIVGVPRGRTPLLLDLPLGRYQLLVERSGFRSLSREIRVASGRAVVVKLELVP